MIITEKLKGKRMRRIREKYLNRLSKWHVKGKATDLVRNAIY